jgi:hypothetical protein
MPVRLVAFDWYSIRKSPSPVFLVENEVMCLAFSRVARSVLIFGEGYAVHLSTQICRLEQERVRFSLIEEAAVGALR